MRQFEFVSLKALRLVCRRLRVIFMCTDKKKKQPGLSPKLTRKGNTSTGRAYLTMKKLNHTQNGFKVKLYRLRNQIKKRSALRIQAESEEKTPKKEAWV